MGNEYDCIIIGAGPGGLSAAIYLGRAHKKTLLVYGGPGRTAHAAHIQNYFGFDDISGQELIDRGMRQAQKYGVEVLLARVKDVRKMENGFEVATAQKTFSAQNVIVASGIDDVMPEIDNIFEFLVVHKV